MVMMTLFLSFFHCIPWIIQCVDSFQRLENSLFNVVMCSLVGVVEYGFFMDTHK